MERLVAVTGEMQFEPGLYIVVDGAARVLRGSEEIATVGPGDFFGELSVIDQMPRNASVQASGPTRCLAVASWDLLDLIETDPKFALNLIKGLVTRLRDQ